MKPDSVLTCSVNFMSFSGLQSIIRKIPLCLFASNLTAKTMHFALTHSTEP